jgi:TetR/AcrR family transcriptional repressor of nem operon
MPKVETFNKELVIKQATEVFHTKSYSLTSMQDLVDATGLNRSSIYNTFGSKLDLYMECLRSYQSESKQEIQHIMTGAKDAKATLKAIFLLNLKKNHKGENDGCLINNCTTEMANQETVINQFLCNNQHGMVQLFQSIVAKGQQEGVFNQLQTPKVYSLYLLNAFQGLRVTGILSTDDNQLKSVVNTTLSILN